ncbi:MAG: WYL domain-containing protein [Verrucomicrobiaceae bacterium]|nr:WYL domain-containing protein [Verrucomicrobiaceae bacterium]
MKKRAAARKTPHSENRQGETRRPIERIFAIHQAIRRGRFPNCRILAEEIGVTPKTIQRDITFMQKDLDLPLTYDSLRHGYHYVRPVHDFPLLKVSVEDIVALFLARRAIEPLQGSPLEAALRDSFRRLSASLAGEVSFRWSDLDEVFSARDSGIVPADVTLFEKVARAILESRELKFDYRKIDGEEWEPRRLQPYHLTEFDGGWYLIGYDPDRKARRTFALQRIRRVRPLKSRFLRPTDFSLKDHLGGSFGVWHSPAAEGMHQRIRLRFTGWAARLVSERRWHPSQQIEWQGKQADELVMTLELSSFEEIRRWILSWGTQVEVLSPPELRAELKEEAEGLAALYRTK